MESLQLTLSSRLCTNASQRDMLRAKSLTQICDVLLSYDNIHLSDIVIILAEEVPKLIHDIPHVSHVCDYCTGLDLTTNTALITQ